MKDKGVTDLNQWRLIFFERGEAMKYLRFITKRICYMLITLLITSFVIFFLLHVFGTKPIITINAGKTVSDEILKSTEAKFNLNKNLITQYGIWLKDSVTGDFGISYVSKQSVTNEIVAKLPVTAAIIFGTMLISMLIALPLGLIQAVFAGKKLDQILSILLVVFASVPSFLLGLIALLIIPYILPGYNVSGGYNNMGEFISRVSVPCVVLAFINIGILSRIMRSSAVEELNKHYVTTAKAKGMPFRKILFGDVVPNSIIPVLTVSSVMIGGIVSESMLVEQIFSLPGLGSMLVKAVSENDFPVTMAITVILLILFMISSLITDVIYTLIDPRVSL